LVKRRMESTATAEISRVVTAAAVGDDRVDGQCDRPDGVVRVAVKFTVRSVGRTSLEPSPILSRSLREIYHAMHSHLHLVRPLTFIASRSPNSSTAPTSLNDLRYTAFSHKLFIGVEWVISARGGLQFFLPKSREMPDAPFSSPFLPLSRPFFLLCRPLLIVAKGGLVWPFRPLVTPLKLLPSRIYSWGDL